MSGLVIAIWCVVGANSIMNLAHRDTLRSWFAALDMYLLAGAMYALARA